MFWITGVLGLALGVAPWVLGYADHLSAMWASVVLGLVVLLVSVWGLISRAADKRWEYWAIGLAGLAAFIAPSSSVTMTSPNRCGPASSWARSWSCWKPPRSFRSRPGQSHSLDTVTPGVRLPTAATLLADRVAATLQYAVNRVLSAFGG